MRRRKRVTLSLEHIRLHINGALRSCTIAKWEHHMHFARRLLLHIFNLRGIREVPLQRILHVMDGDFFVIDFPFVAFISLSLPLIP
jgi:hypothetical protein